MGNFAIKVEGEVVWESEEESDLITGVHVSGPGGEWGHAGSPIGDASINITFDKRSTIDSSHLDLVEREAADIRRTRQEEESKDAVAKGRQMMADAEKKAKEGEQVLPATSVGTQTEDEKTSGSVDGELPEDSADDYSFTEPAGTTEDEAKAFAVPPEKGSEL